MITQENYIEAMYIGSKNLHQFKAFLKKEFYEDMKKEVKSELREEILNEVREEFKSSIKSVNTDGEELYTIHDLMNLFKKSRPSIYKMIKDGKLKRHDLTSRSPRFKKKEIDKYIELAKR
jgi:predicted DNA-binding transcriptional regulator AlpA